MQSKVTATAHSTTNNAKQVSQTVARVSRKLKTLTNSLEQLAKTLTKSSSSARSSRKRLNDLFSFDSINRLSTVTKANTSAQKKSSRRKSSGTRSGTRKQAKNTLSWLKKLNTVLQPVQRLFDKLWSLKTPQLVQELNQLREAAERLAGQVNDALGYAYHNILLPLAQWTMQAAAPAVIHALTGALKLFSGALNVVSPLAQSFWEHFLQPVASWTGEHFVSGITKLGDILTSLGTALDGVAAHINGKDGILQSLSGFAEGVAEALDTSLISGLTALKGKLSDWASTNISQPLSELNPTISILPQLLKTPSQLFHEFAEQWAQNPAVKTLVSLSKDNWSSVREWVSSSLGGAVNALVALVSSGWSTVRDWVSSSLGGAVNALVTLVSSGWSTVRDWVSSSLGGAVNALVTLVSSGWSTVRDWLSGKLGGNVSKDIGLSKSWSSVADWVKSHLGGSVNKDIGLKKDGWSNVGKWVGGSMGDTAQAKIGLKKGWSGSVAKALGLDNLSSKFKITLPTVSVSWSGSPIKLPHFSIKWNAKGGIFDGAQLMGLMGNTLQGVGEAGKEALLPLEHNTGWMDTIADKVAQRVSGGNGGGNAPVNINVTLTLDGKIIGQKTVQYIQSEGRQGRFPLEGFA